MHHRESFGVSATTQQTVLILWVKPSDIKNDTQKDVCFFLLLPAPCQNGVFCFFLVVLGTLHTCPPALQHHRAPWWIIEAQQACDPDPIPDLWTNTKPFYPTIALFFCLFFKLVNISVII